MLVIHYGIDRRCLDAYFRGLGGEIIYLRRTDEVQYVHPLIPHRPHANARRKDAPRHLVHFVLQVVHLVETKAANDEVY